MVEYIKREELLSHYDTSFCKPCKEKKDDYNGVRCSCCGIEDAIVVAESIPAADAVEVVRCKDCKFFERDPRLENETITSVRGFCKKENDVYTLRPLADYCSDAVWREEAVNND